MSQLKKKTTTRALKKEEKTAKIEKIDIHFEAIASGRFQKVGSSFDVTVNVSDLGKSLSDLENQLDEIINEAKPTMHKAMESAVDGVEVVAEDIKGRGLDKAW